MTGEWDHETVWAQVENGREPDTTRVYAEQLGRCPVARVDVQDSRYWAVFGWDDLAAMTANTSLFSNVTPLDGPRILPLQSDPPEHGAYRRLLNPFFTPARMKEDEPAVRRMAAEMIDAMVATGTADFAVEYAYPFPTRTLCKLLRAPDSDWHIHHEFVSELERRTGHGLSAPTESLDEPLQFIMPYLYRLIAERRAAPGDDVVSGIIAGEIEGNRLDDQAVAFMVITLMMAGHITTTSGVGNLVLRLARDEALQSFLRAHPERIPDAVEESLRIDTPQQAMPRRCTADTQLGGRDIAAGDYLLANFGSANVDPNHWDSAATFDIDRKDKRHVAFGRGIHACLGQALARMEMRVTVAELLARTASFSVAGEVKRLAWPRLSVESLPLTLVPAKVSA
jgi:cytochrome P450